MRIKALEDALERMVQVHQQNHESLRRAFNMTDAHLWVLKRISEDSAGKGLWFKDSLEQGVRVMSGGSEIDFHHYYEEFNENQRQQMVAQEAASAAKLKKAEEKEAEKQAQQEDVVVFGGDQDGASP